MSEMCQKQEAKEAALTAIAVLCLHDRRGAVTDYHAVLYSTECCGFKPYMRHHMCSPLIVFLNMGVLCAYFVLPSLKNQTASISTMFIKLI